MLCQFLLHNEANHPYIDTYPFPLGPPFHPPPSHTSSSSQNTELSSLCYRAASHEHFIIFLSVKQQDLKLQRYLTPLLFHHFFYLSSLASFYKFSFFIFLLCNILKKKKNSEQKTPLNRPGRPEAELSYLVIIAEPKKKQKDFSSSCQELSVKSHKLFLYYSPPNFLSSVQKHYPCFVPWKPSLCSPWLQTPKCNTLLIPSLLDKYLAVSLFHINIIMY